MSSSRYSVTDTRELLGSRAASTDANAPVARHAYKVYGKRALDVCAASAALLLLSPLLAVLALAVRAKLGSPVLFRQARPGLRGAPFTILKFRTMTDARCDEGALLDDRNRTTGLGLFLRRTSLDELPQLINVLRGEMSLVGPRPLLMKYLPLYSPRQKRRHETRPGITGWAQVNGRNAITWAEKFERDVWYVENQSLRLDLLILWRTVTPSRSSGERAPMPEAMVAEFTGEPE